MVLELSDEQKEQAIKEFTHYLMMDCYDFSISIGGWDLYAGEIAAPLTQMFEEELEEDDDDVEGEQ